jgi:hypothetical protein
MKSLTKFENITASIFQSDCWTMAAVALPISSVPFDSQPPDLAVDPPLSSQDSELAEGIQDSIVSSAVPLADGFVAEASVGPTDSSSPGPSFRKTLGDDQSDESVRFAQHSDLSSGSGYPGGRPVKLGIRLNLTDEEEESSSPLKPVNDSKQVELASERSRSPLDVNTRFAQVADLDLAATNKLSISFFDVDDSEDDFPIAHGVPDDEIPTEEPGRVEEGLVPTNHTCRGSAVV